MAELTFYYLLLSTARPDFLVIAPNKKHQEKDKFLFYVYKNKRRNYRTAKRNIKSQPARLWLPPHLAPTTISELSAKNGKFFFIGGVTGESKLPLAAEAGLRLGESQPKPDKLIHCITMCVGRADVTGVEASAGRAEDDAFGRAERSTKGLLEGADA